MKIVGMPVISGIIILIIVVSSIGGAQGSAVVRDSLYSEALQEKRYLEILLPDKYEQKAGEKYEVIYLLDGEWNINLVPFIHRFAQQENYLPPAIFVGLPNTYNNGVNQRDRDFLPANGADKFLDFLRKEVIPYIGKKYSTNGDRTLFGHSYGGLFVAYTFLTDHRLFNAYLASDPAFHWNNGFILNYAKERLPKISGENKLFWIDGIQSTYKYMGIDIMDSVFKELAPKDLHWKIALYPNETHNSVRLKGVYDGLKFFYDGFSISRVNFHPMNGIALKEKPFGVFVFGNAQVRYTIDGTDPSIMSAKADSIITLPGPVELKARSFNVRGANKEITTGNFREGKAFKARSKPGGVRPGGLNYSYFRGEWDTLPDFSRLTPVHSGHVDSTFNLENMPDKLNFGIVMDGFLEIRKEGYYIFTLDSDDGARICINDEPILTYDGLHGMGNTHTYMLPLKKGFYPIHVEYFQKGGGKGFDVRYVPPGQKQPQPMPIPFETLYSR
ncbi:MAG: chitobiase/beta-hexosaminidase C-terminal domain-containing protein [Bacteroidetes bacterium]|nr:chitobiase/beta-hexosaminidase C-terminal domain-containing protein [Bacteroidota bacterium]